MLSCSTQQKRTAPTKIVISSAARGTIFRTCSSRYLPHVAAHAALGGFDARNTVFDVDRCGLSRIPRRNQHQPRPVESVGGADQRVFPGHRDHRVVNSRRQHLRPGSILWRGACDCGDPLADRSWPRRKAGIARLNISAVTISRLKRAAKVRRWNT